MIDASTIDAEWTFSDEAIGANLPVVLEDLDCRRIDWRAAKLPAVYENARSALAECERVDECTDWAAKADAIGSYARQAKDNELVDMAQRIRLRAWRRLGELLLQHDARGGDRSKSVDDPTSGRRAVAEAAGLSKHQHVQAVRIASVPEAPFATAVENSPPPTLTALSAIGRKTQASNVVHLYGEAEPQFARAIHQHADKLSIGHVLKALGGLRRCDDRVDIATYCEAIEDDPQAQQAMDLLLRIGNELWARAERRDRQEGDDRWAGAGSD